MYLKKNIDLIDNSEVDKILNEPKNSISNSYTDPSTILEFSAQVMRVNPKEDFFLITVTRSGNAEIQVFFTFVSYTN